MHTNGNEEKGKEGRQEKEVVPFEASSREPSVPKVFAQAKTFSFLALARSSVCQSCVPTVAAQQIPSRVIHSFHQYMNSCALDACCVQTYYRGIRLHSMPALPR